MRREAKHVHRSLTPAEGNRVNEARTQVEAESADIRRRAREVRQEIESAHSSLEAALQMLKMERERQGLSLADVTERTGIDRPNLSRLENEPAANPTVATLARYADALGKRLLVVLADK